MSTLTLYILYISNLKIDCTQARELLWKSENREQKNDKATHNYRFLHWLEVQREKVGWEME